MCDIYTIATRSATLHFFLSLSISSNPTKTMKRKKSHLFRDTYDMYFAIFSIFDVQTRTHTHSCELNVISVPVNIGCYCCLLLRFLLLYFQSLHQQIFKWPSKFLFTVNIRHSKKNYTHTFMVIATTNQQKTTTTATQREWIKCVARVRVRKKITQTHTHACTLAWIKLFLT